MGSREKPLAHGIFWGDGLLANTNNVYIDSPSFNGNLSFNNNLSFTTT
jgi:hypothetical protein